MHVSGRIITAGGPGPRNDVKLPRDARAIQRITIIKPGPRIIMRSVRRSAAIYGGPREQCRIFHKFPGAVIQRAAFSAAQLRRPRRRAFTGTFPQFLNKLGGGRAPGGRQNVNRARSILTPPRETRLNLAGRDFFYRGPARLPPAPRASLELNFRRNSFGVINRPEPSAPEFSPHWKNNR